MRKLLLAIKRVIEEDLSGTFGGAAIVIDPMEYPDHLVPPFVALKDGDVQGSYFGGGRQESLTVTLIVLADLSAGSEGSIVGDGNQPGVLELVETLKDTFIGKTITPEGYTFVNVNGESGSAFVQAIGKDGKPTGREFQAKLISMTWEACG